MILKNIKNILSFYRDKECALGVWVKNALDLNKIILYWFIFHFLWVILVNDKKDCDRGVF